MNSDLLMVVDGTNLAVRAHYAYGTRKPDGSYESLSTSDGRESGALYGSIVNFCQLVRQIKPTHILYTFDCGKSKLRYGLAADYKGDRPEKDFDLTYQYSAFDTFLSLVDARYYREQNVEADDLIASAVHQWKKDLPVVVVSCDHDLRQLIGPNVAVLSPGMGSTSKERIYYSKDIHEKYGVTVDRLAEMWALTGDASDNIKGIHRVGEKTAAKIINSTENWLGVLQHPKVVEHRELVERNLRLIQLDGREAAFNVDLDSCRFGRPGPTVEEWLENYFSDWEFKSLLKKMEAGTLWQ